MATLPKSIPKASGFTTMIPPLTAAGPHPWRRSA
jgi:hypothetical protein